MFKRLGGFVVAVALAAGLGACATTATSIDAQWVDPAVVGKQPVKSVMVLSAVRDATNRRIFEDRMVATLTASGVKAVQSYKFIPDEAPVAEEALRNAVKQAGVSHAMVTRIINVSTQVNVSPGMVMGPRPTISPTSPGAHASPSSLTMRISNSGGGAPTLPGFCGKSNLSRMVTKPSVRPYSS